MKITIAGTGSVSRFLASNFCQLGHEVRIIGLDKSKLEQLEQDFDLMTYNGDSTHRSLQLKAEMSSTDLFVAVMTSEAENILAAGMAKKMGLRALLCPSGRPRRFLQCLWN